MINLVELNKNDCISCAAKGCSSCRSGSSNADIHAPTLFTRRNFGRTVLSASAGALLAGCSSPAKQAAPAAGAKTDTVAAGLSPDLAVVKQSKGPIMTTLTEFYKMGPGPSSSHTMGPMRITYDFFQRISKLPEDKLKQATGLKVHLFGSLSATGKGHGTDRASLAGLLGKSPAECPPQFLDELAANPDKSYKLTIGPKTLDLTLKDVIFDATKGDFHHPNTMTCVLLAGTATLFELEYYSVGGGFIEWKGYVAPEKGQPKYPFAYAKELQKFLIDDNIPLGKILLENSSIRLRR
jgi:L-serine dehydratase